MQDIFVKGFFFFFSFTPQWLVKKAIERKEEMGDYIREFSVSQFSKYHTTPQVNAKCLSWVLNSWKPHLWELRSENNRALWVCAGSTPCQNCAQTPTSEPAWKLGASSPWVFPSRRGKGLHSRVASTAAQFPRGWPCLMLMWDPLTPCTLEAKRRACLHALWNAKCSSFLLRLKYKFSNSPQIAAFPLHPFPFCEQCSQIIHFLWDVTKTENEKRKNWNQNQ